MSARPLAKDATIIVLAALGMISGVGLAYAMRRYFSGEFAVIYPIFTPQTFVFTWLLCLILSIVSGFYPAWRASQLDPVVALRHE